ncbi:hypothetical protein [Limnohabitans lacus]|uniref:DNA-binding protein n=1 Tax=Limnohabitans lacus TaxID=3045173 RepID=A0ABT6X890_9BURK|nr:hypothetical protein [Limnohabitans sp. HM2-2]MDI9234357.1 hypothetical protein [Limnohabitans sp. HM2-2]
MTPKRGLTHAEAMAYVGVKRRTFDEVWRPKLVGMRQGACMVFDRLDLDRLFDQFKQEAAGQPVAANDSTSPASTAHNGDRNERPAIQKGEKSWAKKQGASTPTQTGYGRLTSGSVALDFASAASRAMTKRNAG